MGHCSDGGFHTGCAAVFQTEKMVMNIFNNRRKVCLLKADDNLTFSNQSTLILYNSAFVIIKKCSVYRNYSHYLHSIISLDL